MGLLPLVRRDLAARWWSQVHASDGSRWGRGVVVGHREPQEVHRIAHHCECWRFKKEQEKGASARLNAFMQLPLQDGCEVLQDEEMDWQADRETQADFPE
eukprot:5184276-Heterocapsa_arctica.AAC.1